MKAESEERKTEKEAKRRARFWREVLSWVWVILAFILIEGTLGQARVIPSASMENTILIGDHLLISRFGYDAGVPFTQWHVPLWKSPKRQQIIVFEAVAPGSQDLIKRVIGLPGDRLAIRKGVVYINGKALSEPYAVHHSMADGLPGGDFPPSGDDSNVGLQADWAAEISRYVQNGELVVPPDRYFVMGDNRENSYDSRFWGFVPRANIIGTPLCIYMSIDAPEEVWEPQHLGERFGAYFNALVHPREVRWRRLFGTF